LFFKTGGFDSYETAAVFDIDGRYRLYAYNCDGQRCTGFATDLWRAIGRGQQQAFLDAVVDQLVIAFPDSHSYVAAAGGDDTKGSLGARATQSASGERFYWFFPADQ
jgi:hypothetical protein